MCVRCCVPLFVCLKIFVLFKENFFFFKLWEMPGHFRSFEELKLVFVYL